MLNINTFYISDTHFHHKNIIQFENRPYNSVEEMNEDLIRVWNKHIKPGDVVHHLGDFCFGGYNKWVSILERLNGRIVLYKGNHDNHKLIDKLLSENYFENVLVADYKLINKLQLYLSHFPMEIGDRSRLYSICGHVHSNDNSYHNQVNVGVDSPLNFGREFGKPVSEHELITYLESLEYGLYT